MSLEHELLQHFVSAHPSDAALAFTALSADERAQVFTNLEPTVAAGLLRFLPSLSASRALENVPIALVAAVLGATRTGVAAAVLRVTAKDRRASIIGKLSAKHRLAISNLLLYAEDTAGALMDPGVVTAYEQESAGYALELLRRDAQHGLYYLYVVGQDQRLVGVINIRELMRARPDAALAGVCIRAVDSVSANSTWETVLHHPAWGRIHALPVVDAESRFAGVIRYETVRQLEQKQNEVSLADQGLETASALGELFGLGLRGLFRSATVRMERDLEPAPLASPSEDL